jgi:hypothetical protein
MAKKTKAPDYKETTGTIQVYTRDHDDQSYRVWREGWEDDQFEVIGKAGFSTFALIADRLGVAKVTHKEGDEE